MMIKLSSVYQGVFKLSLILSAVLLLNCGSQYSLSERQQSIADIENILNLKLIASIGPNLADGHYMLEPSFVITNNIGDIFISDKYLHKIFRLNKNLEFVSDEGGIGLSLSGMNSPQGMSCDAALNLYIADSGNKRISTMDRNLRFANELDSYYLENKNTERFIDPVDLAVDNEGNLWVADYDRILKISPFNELLLEISYNAPGNFSVGRVSSIAVSYNDIIAVADPEYQRIVVFSQYGQVFSEIDSGPVNSVAWDNNIIWAVNESGDRITAYSIAGNIVFRWAESSPGSKISAIAFDNKNRLILVDKGLRKILLYEKIYATGHEPEE